MANRFSRSAWALLLLPAAVAMAGCGSDKGASEKLGSSRSALTLAFTPATSNALASVAMAPVTASLGTGPYTCAVLTNNSGSVGGCSVAAGVVSYTAGPNAGFLIRNESTDSWVNLATSVPKTGATYAGAEIFYMTQSGSGFIFQAKSNSRYVKTDTAGTPTNLIANVVAGGDVYVRNDCNGANNNAITGDPGVGNRWGFTSLAGTAKGWKVQGANPSSIGSYNGGATACTTTSSNTSNVAFYVVPATDTLRITDSTGMNMGDLRVSVEKPIAFLPSTQSVAANTAITAVQVWGGSGNYTSCTVTTNNSGGGACTLPATGAGIVSYTTGNAGGTDTLRVTDSEGHTGTFTVTAAAGPLTLAASTRYTLASSAMATVSFSGGAGPYTCAISTNRSGGASCSVAGNVVSYTAGPTAGYFIKSQRSGDYLRSVNVATVPTASTGGAIGSSAVFWKKSTALGGVTFQALPPLTNNYMALADSSGSPLTINGTAATATLFTEGNCTPGATPRFGYRASRTVNLDWQAGDPQPTVKGVGSLCNPATGSAWEGFYLEAGTDVLTISDSTTPTAQSGTITVTVENPISFWPTPVVIASSSAVPAAVHAWGGSGLFTGATPCVVQTNATGSAGTCSITASGFITYTTGAGTGTDVLRITDSQGHTGDLPITVAGSITPITIAPVQPPVTLAPRASSALAVTPAGGVYTYTLVSNNSGATINSSTGLYTAGTTPGVSDLVQVTDANGNTGYVTVTVGPGISVTPSQPAVLTSGTQTFTATGGSGTGFTWTLLAGPSGGSISAGGAYTAGSTGATDQIRVTDSLGNTKTVDVIVSCGADKDLKILYPYNATVFPLGMLPPVVQWTDNGTAAYAEISLRYPATGTATFYWREIVPHNGPLAAPYNTLPTTLAVVGGGRAQIPTLVWRTFANAAAGQDALISVKVLENNKGTIPATIRVHFATEQLKGTIYYGTYDAAGINNGATLKIKVGETTPTVVDGSASACRGCHSMSADGTRAVVSDGDSGTVQLYSKSLTRNLITNVETAIGVEPPTGAFGVGGTNDGRYAWPAISPDGSVMFGNAGDEPGALSGQWGVPATFASALYSLPNGTAVTTVGIPTGLQAMFPAFATDTSAVAFSYSDYDGRTLAMMTTTKDSPTAGTWTFGTPVKLFTPPRLPIYTVTADSGVAAWPSFMPAGQNGIVVQNQVRHNCFRPAGDGPSSPHATNSLTHNIGGQGDLWWVNTTGTPLPTRLNRANGVGYLPKGPNGHGLPGTTIPSVSVNPTDSAGGTPTAAQISGASACQLDLRQGIGNGDDTLLNFKPSVNPTITGGYQWVVFMSRRMYGNVITINPYASSRAGTPALQPPGTAMVPLQPPEKKLWVAAMNTNPAAGSDPSYPAFYLDGQDLWSGNSRSYWVQPQCAPAASGAPTAANLCTSNADCCQTVPTVCKLDIPIAANPATAHCIASSAMTCAADGAACNVDGDCCTVLSSGTRCSGNVCTVPPSGDGYPNSDQVFYDFEGTCEETGAHPVWQLLETQQIIAGDSSIKFEVQSAATPAGLITAPKATTHTATATAQPPMFTTGPATMDEVLRALPTPGASRALLRVTVTLNPSTDHTQSPTLTGVTPTYDCLFDE